MSEYAIWWISQCDYEQMEMIIAYTEDAYSHVPDVERDLRVPKYIASEFLSRVGRAGRGRLWVPPNIPIKEIEWDESNPITRMAAKCGGIVLLAADVASVISLPGFVTDTNMKLWSVT